jgi:hypothetical protein
MTVENTGLRTSPEAKSDSDKQKKPYQAPRILSAEFLEASAASCGPAGPLGKSSFPVCQTLGS